MGVSQVVKSILFSIFAVSLFAAGAVGSWYMTNLAKKDAPEETAVESVAETNESEVSSPLVDLSEMGTPVLPKAMSAEDLFRISAMNKKNIELQKKQRESLRQEKLKLKLAEKDLDVRKQEIEGILKQSQRAVAEAENMVVQLQNEIQKLKADKAAAEAQAPEVPGAMSQDVQANIKKVSQWFALMPAESASQQIKALMNDGKKDFVLQVLGNMEQRNAAKILTGLDSPLGAELANSFQTASIPKKQK